MHVAVSEFSVESVKKSEKNNNWQERFHKSYMSTLPCERGKAAAKDSYEIQLTHQQLSFSLLP